MTPLEKRYALQFKCDNARIRKVGGTWFLCLGWNRRSEGQWFKNGEPFNFDYLEEKVVASGKTMKELIASAEKYRRCVELDEKYPTPKSRLNLGYAKELMEALR
jgi:hypothetical protein